MHACEAETSMMMVVAPDCVRTDKLPDAHGAQHLTAATALARPLHVWKSFKELTASGVAGDARKSTAAKGEALLDTAAALLAERLIAGEPWT
jgi:creatinine amidohydrolase